MVSGHHHFKSSGDSHRQFVNRGREGREEGEEEGIREEGTGGEGGGTVTTTFWDKVMLLIQTH